VTTKRIFAIATPTPGTTLEDMLPVLPYEAQRTWELYAAGVAREVWLRADGLGATAVLESTPEEAIALTADFPMARAGLVRFECIPVRPFDPLAGLFGAGAGEPEPVPATGGSPTQRVLTVLRATEAFDPQTVRPQLLDEARAVWALWKAGVIREPYVRDGEPGGVLVMEAPDAAAADAALTGLPLVRSGALRAQSMTVGVFAAWDALLEGGLPAPSPAA
jgi:hypothetical protein